METGKPDEVGALGEKTLQSLKLPRPETSGFGCLFQLLALGLSVFFYVRFRDQIYDFLPSNFISTEDLKSFPVVLVLWAVISKHQGLFIYKKRRALQVVLERCATQNDVESEPFVLWHADSVLRRVLNPVLGLLASVIFAGLFGISSVRFEKLIFVAGAVSCFCLSVVEVESVFKPLLVLNTQNVMVGRRVVDWAQIQKVKVEHLLDSSGDYISTRWTFFGARKRLARVTVRKERCSQEREEEMLLLAARKLGNEIRDPDISSVVHPDINWI